MISGTRARMHKDEPSREKPVPWCFRLDLHVQACVAYRK